MSFASMIETREMLGKKGMPSLSPFSSGGLIWTRGRWGKQALTKILGHEKLLLLSPKSRYAYLLLVQAHEEDHRQDPADALHRVRRYGVWVVKGISLAKFVTRRCPFCILHSYKTALQQMSDLPDQHSRIPCRPWSHIALDFTAPMMVRIPKKKEMLGSGNFLLSCLPGSPDAVGLAYGPLRLEFNLGRATYLHRKTRIL